MNILYIEDNTLDRNLVERYVKTTSHRLIVVSNPQDVDLPLVQFDLVLLDIYFDGKATGLDYLQQLRDAGIDCPVVAVTARALPHQLTAYRKMGIDRILAKPFEITELADTLTYYLQ